MTPTLSVPALRLPDIDQILSVATDLAARIRAGDTGRDHATGEALAGTLSLARHGSPASPTAERIDAALRRYAVRMPSDPTRAVAGLVADCESLHLPSESGEAGRPLPALALPGRLDNAVLAHAHLVAASHQEGRAPDAAGRATLAAHLRLAVQYHDHAIEDVGLRSDRDTLVAERAAVAEYLDEGDIVAILAASEDDYARITGRIHVARRMVMQAIMSLRAQGD